jgi:hypothetical protein
MILFIYRKLNINKIISKAIKYVSHSYKKKLSSIFQFYITPNVSFVTFFFFFPLILCRCYLQTSFNTIRWSNKIKIYIPPDKTRSANNSCLGTFIVKNHENCYVIFQPKCFNMQIIFSSVRKNRWKNNDNFFICS